MKIFLYKDRWTLSKKVYITSQSLTFLIEEKVVGKGCHLSHQIEPYMC